MPEPSNLLIGLLGISTFFIVLIFFKLCKIANLLADKEEIATEIPATTQNTVTPVSVTPAVTVSQPIENRQEIIAAVSAAIAEELGTDISALRIISFKKI